MSTKNTAKESNASELWGFHQSLNFIKVLRTYHRHKVSGLDYVPTSGRAILVINHAIALYDIIMLWDAIFKSSGRYTRTLVDRFFYKIPFLDKALLNPMGINVACWDNARKLLNANELILLSPGGMREWGKPSSQKYTINWSGRKGYAKLAIQTQSPIILAASPSADDIFDVYDNPVSKFLYKKFRVPFTLVKGLGPTNLPKPVKVTHYLSKPIQPPPMVEDPQKFEEAVDKFHEYCQAEMRRMLQEGEKVGFSQAS